MRAVIHIGTEKTGTTTIQEYLFQNQQELKYQGYFFIQSAGKISNRALAAYCMSLDKYDDFFRERRITDLKGKDEFKEKFLKKFQEEIQSIPENVHTVIISSEHLHSRTNTYEEVLLLRDLLSPYFNEFKIICYLKEQSNLLTSLYSTYLRGGGVEGLDARCEKRCHPQNNYYNYEKMLLNWENVFGLESLSISIFSGNSFLNGDLLDDFIAQIDEVLLGKLDKKTATKNESLNYLGQQLTKAANISISREPENSDTKQLASKLRNLISQRYKGKGEQLKPPIKKEIMSLFSESNEKVRLKFFPHLKKLFELTDRGDNNCYEVDDNNVINLSDIFTLLLKSEEFVEFSRELAIFKSDKKRLQALRCQKLGDFNSAHRLFEEAIALNEDFKNYRDYSVFLKEQNNHEKSLEMCCLAISLEPNRPWLKELKLSIINDASPT